MYSAHKYLSRPVDLGDMAADAAAGKVAAEANSEKLGLIKTITDGIGGSFRAYIENWLNNNIWSHGNYGLVAARNEALYGRVALRQAIDANGSGSIKSVQRGVGTGYPIINHAISAVNMSKSFVIVNCEGNTVSGRLTSGSNVEIRKGSSGSWAAFYTWQVVEFK